MKLIEPSGLPRSSIDRVAHDLCAGGWPAESLWIANVLLDPDVIPIGVIQDEARELRDTWRTFCWSLTNAHKRLASSDGAILDLVILLARGGFQLCIGHEEYSRSYRLPEPCLGELIHRCSKRIDFAAAFPRACTASPEPQLVPGEAAKILWHFGALEPGMFIDRQKLRALAAESGWLPQRWYNLRAEQVVDPTTLEFWLVHCGPSVLSGLARDLANPDIAAVAALATGIGNVIHGTCSQGGLLHHEWYSEYPFGFQDAVVPLFEQLEQRRENANVDGLPPEFIEAWLRFAWMAYDQRSERLDENLRRQVVSTASSELGRMRPSFRAADLPQNEKPFEGSHHHFQCCVHITFDFGGLWAGMKPLILALRALSARAVGDDLRYWDDGIRENAPRPWNRIPMALTSMFHHYAGREEQRDPNLELLRSEFARFCLEGLKSRQGSKTESALSAGELVESHPTWRRCFIRAAEALCVNPGESKHKGHHILNWSRQNDPDPLVREAATIAYGKLRHQPRLPEGMSPRRAVITAFWWLRQAHLLALNPDMEICGPGAQRTLEMEVRRTAEKLDKQH
ncbi:MAG: hypothetical protein L0Y42_09890 [Phycisphaerales bacterium]|nr:hypothetical protein [Phycisphaerales bacterium]